MGRASLLILIAPLWIAASVSDPQLRNHSCYKQISTLLDTWEVSRFWRLEDTGPVEIHRTATGQQGIWLESHKHPGGKIEIIQLSGTKLTRVTWNPGSCDPTETKETLSYDRVKLNDAFSDEYLDRILKENRAGIIYAWSPHMPLSVDGRYRVQRAATQLNLRVFVALDPHADSAMAKAIVTRRGWDTSTLRRLESIELFNRGMGNHYPVMVVFKNGNIVGPVFPGVKEESVYLKFISERLAKK